MVTHKKNPLGFFFGRNTKLLQNRVWKATPTEITINNHQYQHQASEHQITHTDGRNAPVLPAQPEKPSLTSQDLPC